MDVACINAAYHNIFAASSVCSINLSIVVIFIYLQATQVKLLLFHFFLSFVFSVLEKISTIQQQFEFGFFCWFLSELFFQR